MTTIITMTMTLKTNTNTSSWRNCFSFLFQVCDQITLSSGEQKGWEQSFMHSVITVYKAHYNYVSNAKSEALEAVARWSVICKILSFQVALEGMKWRRLSDRKWQLIPDFRGTLGKTYLSKTAVAAWCGWQVLTDWTEWPLRLIRY